MKHYYLWLFLFFSFIGFSQNDLIQKANSFIQSNECFSNQPKEKFFLHTNKTTYFSGEYINFKAYVVDDVTNKPSQITTNLHISIYDSNRKLLIHQLVFVDEGMVNGSIKLDKNLKTGPCYILLDTYYNTNFDNKNITKIQVLNLGDKKASPDYNASVDTVSTQIEESSKLQVLFYPESHVLLSRANNTLFYKALFNGIPFSGQGELINANSEIVIDTFSTNREGIGSVNFDYFPNQSYYFKIQHGEKEYKIDLPLAQKEGFVVHYDSQMANSKGVDLVIRVNNETANTYNNEPILAVIHRGNTSRSVIPFKIDKSVNNYRLNIPSESLFNGINIVSLFNKNNKLLSNRYFFYDKNKNVELDLIKVAETKDSLTIDLKMPNSYIQANTSISILPKQSVLNKNSNTIYKAFMLSPYVPNIRSMEDLDLSIQIYSPKDSILETSKNKAIKSVENGVSIIGQVQSRSEKMYGYQVLLTSKENGLALMSPLEDGNKFYFDNLLLYHPSQFDLALLNPSGQVVEAEFELNEQVSNYPVDSILTLNQETEISKIRQTVGYSKTVTQAALERGSNLDEVLLYGKKSNKEEEEVYPDFGYVDMPGELGNGATRQKTKDEIDCMGCTLFEYLDQFPELKTLRVEPGDSTNPEVEYLLTFKNRGINTVYGSITALLIIDGIPSSYSALEDYMAEDVKAVKLNRSGAGYGFRGSNGVVIVELKKPEDYMESESTKRTRKKNKVYSSSTSFGFSRMTESFNESNLVFNNQDSIDKFGTIDWIPNFKLRPNSSNYIKLAKEEFSAISLIINGMNNQGYLVFKQFDVPFN
ncbi:hypothetical protein OS188_02480 [Xanthomarina sp. F1114]|uniref:hypothetical protein n=1 Tax=Xanthomarina sp. F1114 TaxID=2996019 RepID=UPI00225E5F4F|nr:hypothetical protein [Xanthomarina sp. F1114]MCX7546814.1 hypothetical protein [Xanthomarina sp. F1114]